MVTSTQKTIYDRLRDYYRGERISNALLLFIGVGGITWTSLLYLWRQGNLSSALFYSAIPLGLFYIITGGYRFIRSIKRYRQGSNEYHGLDYLMSDEFVHLSGRNQRFMKKRKIDTIGFLLGFVICISCVVFNWNHLILGTAVNITIFSAFLLAFDLFGQFRTQEFLHHLDRKRK